MSKTNATHGGSRPGAGRPRKGDGLRRPVTFSVSEDTARMIQELRYEGEDVNGLVAHTIATRYEHKIIGVLQIEK